MGMQLIELPQPDTAPSTATRDPRPDSSPRHPDTLSVCLAGLPDIPNQKSYRSLLEPPESAHAKLIASKVTISIPPCGVCRPRDPVTSLA